MPLKHAKWITGIITLLLIFPIVIGLVGTLLPAFAYFPPLGEHTISLAPWRQLFDQGEFYASLKLTLITGIGAPILSLWLALSLLAWGYQRPFFRKIEALLSPILAIPHAAIAIGLLFLLSPSGWLVRLFSPWLTGFDRPPNWITVQDPYGVSLILALVIKEMPYLLYVMLATMKSIKARESLQVGQALGYSRFTLWRKVLIPQLYPIIRLPIFIVIAFSLTVVDLALVIGPNTPSTLAVTLLRWFNDPDLSMRLMASAGAISLMLVIVLVLASWEVAHLLFRQLTRAERSNGKRFGLTDNILRLGVVLGLFTLLNAFVALALLPIWSLARRWRFPDALPSQWTWDNIDRAMPLLMELSRNTLIVAIVATLIACGISLVMLETKRHATTTATALNRPHVFDWLIYVPILLPQIGFLFGLHILLIYLNLNGDLCAIIALHLMYVLPYVYLTLKGPYLAYQEEYLQQANRLNHRPWRNYVLVKIAMLKPALFTAFAIGFSVSIAQYLPTLIAGEGRYSTLTTEAVAQAASGDRKQVGSMALLQAVFPILVFWLALAIPPRWTKWRLALKTLFSKNSKRNQKCSV
ncbi:MULTISPECIES: ABC transporter permease [Marinomonas]|uniref:ABC transporter permease subunit n=1 Tax=Marinomonas arctica TaxID=383750 RepID=A0A7H1J1D8_9GAMM|nr:MULTISPECIES: ABC transporter permease subunit [Marinomonas]MCS7488277.1 ABC transporter permease [Marinomonas sp. BSi20414]QNT04304.1 ABC transporter permease subunit [Marinomonas arctica]GGN37790.1 ABC transporter permease [Marinomonas arctica]